MSLNVEGGGPLYQQLRQDLFARIRRGEFPPGGLLPSESQICERYSVSVTTARRALLELVKEGVVRRRAGVGTIVTTGLRRAHVTFAMISDEADSWREVSAAMAEIIGGIGELTWQRDSSFSTTSVDEAGAVAFLTELTRARRTDGVVLRTANDIREDQLQALEAGGMPYVVIKRELRGRPMNCVVTDDYQGSREMTRHLIGQGHGRIAFVCAKPELTMTRERLAGYRDELAAGGIPLESSLIRLQESFTEGAGHAAARSLLGERHRPTAIFSASDTMAVGAYRAAAELGLGIPDQVAIAGYDDIAPAALLQPPLTTVRTSYHDFGLRAAELLLDLIEGRLDGPRRHMVPHLLQVRASTGKPPAEIRTPLQPGRPTGHAGVHQRIRVQGDQPEAGLLAGAIRSCWLEALEPGRAHGSETAEVLVLDLGRGLESSLQRAVTEGEAMARLMAPRAGTLLLVALGSGTVGAVSAGARAALEEVASSLNTRWKGRGVRVNAVLAAGPAAPGLPGPCRFLLSPDAARVGGQILIVTDEALEPGFPAGRGAGGSRYRS
ncbi:MAG TPA: substrate-binding domain-containing protein [Candidatus Dormibacteraeota bacterium]|nr:substrate-binding domain-containing protein [Candidatus Dormibacteraeota bacterium]